MGRRRPFAIAALALVAAVGAGGVLAARPGGGDADSVRVAVPAFVETDTSTALEFSLPAQAAAVEGRVLFDTEAAELVGIAPAGGGEALAPQEVSGGFAFGAYDLRPRAGRTMLRVVVAPQTVGRLEVRLVVDAAADAAGRRLRLSNAVVLSALRVGGGTGRLAAPLGRPAHLPTRAAGPARDLFGDGVLGELDVDVVRAGWELARLNDSACTTESAADANGDGCVDILDVQAVFAAQGRQASPVSAATSDTAPPAEARHGSTAALGQPSSSGLAAADASGATFVVNSTADTADRNGGDGVCADSRGRCTLRAAITEANWQRGENRIEFNLSGTAPVPIQIDEALPSLLLQDRTGGTFIDGYSQPGSRVNTAAHGSNAIPGVELRGTAGRPRGNAFRITSASNTIRGFVLNNHYRAIVLDTTSASGNRLLGNWIGFTRGGANHSYRGNQGVRLNNGANDNVVGTPALADRNVIGPFTHPVDLYGPGTDRNTVQNNALCMTPSGTTTSDCATAIDLNFGPQHNLFGGLGAREGNVIGRSRLNGVEISHGWDPDKRDTSDKWQNNHNRVAGNWIGFRADGRYDAAFRSGQNAPNSNDANGVNVYDGGHFNVVEGNWIASVHDGVNTMSPTTSNTLIRNNVIGESPRGEAAPLNRHGIHVRVSTKTHLIEGNVIRNVGGYGIGLTQKDVLWVRMSRNIVSGISGTPIYLQPDPNNPSRGANNLLAAPVISSATTARVRGTGLAGATVELFRASRAAGQSGLPVAYIGSAVVASNGTWSVAVSLESGERVTATQTNSAGNTSAVGRNVSVALASSAPQPSEIAADAFGRSLSNGWGTADVGGSYSLRGGQASHYSVTGGTGTIRVPRAGNSRSALLDSATGRDVDLTFRVAADKAAAGGSYVVYAVARRNSNNEYRARLTFDPNGTMSVNASVLANGAERSLGAPVVVSGLGQAPATFVWVRARISGTSPTSIRVKAWADGQSEPARWTFSATNSRAVLQGDGTVGLRAWLSSRVSNAAVTFRFDDYAVQPAS